MPNLAQSLISAVGRSLQGKDDAIELCVVALLAGGHLLIEDHPGVGKTLLARALARALDLPFQRVQCTADLLPADILGGQVYNPRTGELTFQPGPVFTSVLLADELNRTPPRTQSALLECMAEGSVTIGRTTHPLPDPFFVIATQNPTEAAGTYPLPDSQLDRFLLRIRLGYPDAQHEAAILALDDSHRRAAQLTPVATPADLRATRAQVDAVRCAPELALAIVELANRTRRRAEIAIGVSPRGTQALHRACRARAVVHGRDFVVPDDVRTLALAAWAHRVVPQGGGDGEALLEELLADAALPD